MRFSFNGAASVELNNRTIDLTKAEVEERAILTVADALRHLFDNHKEVRESFFDHHGELMHGTICIINKMDWEIMEKEKTPVAHGDHIVLISTIHGG